VRTQWILRSVALAAAFASVSLLSCSSGGDSPAEPVDTTPQPGHVYNWAGTGSPGYGATGGTPSHTQLYWPQDVVFAPDGTPYVLDWNNHRILAVDANGHFKLVVGVADGDFGDPCINNLPDCQGVNATNAKLNHPTQVAFDPANGDMILAAWHNSEIFRLDLNTGLMDRICGDGSRGFNGDNQPAITAYVDLPVGVAFDPQGRLVFADQANQVIRMIDDNGMISSIAGTAPIFNGVSWQKQPGFDGDGYAATLAHLHFEVGQVADPSGKICYDAVGNLYIADSQNHCIRVVDTGGIIDRFAGVGKEAGYDGDGGSALAAHLREPRDVAFDSNGNLYIADTGNHVVRMVTPAGVISTVAGHYRPGGSDIAPVAAATVRGESGALAAAITLTAPYGVTVDSNDRLWICDTGNHVIRVLYP
jgi:adhesin/invasin